MASIAAGKLSFTEQMRSIGREPSSKFISQNIVPATEKIARALRMAEGTSVIEITRVRLADHVPILLETACLSTAQFPTLENHDWSRDESLYKVLSDEYRITISVMDHTIKPVALNETEARYLQAKPGIPALLSQIIAYTEDGAPVEYAWSVSNGDKSEFYFHFQRTE